MAVQKWPWKWDLSHFGSVIWGNVLKMCVFSACFLPSDSVKLLSFTVMFIGFALGNSAIMDYLEFPILSICVCF